MAASFQPLILRPHLLPLMLTLPPSYKDLGVILVSPRSSKVSCHLKIFKLTITAKSLLWYKVTYLDSVDICGGFFCLQVSHLLIFYLFIWLRGVLVIALRILRCSLRILKLRLMGSVVVASGLSCIVACRILVLQPGIEPTSSALQGRFLTTGPPGKSPFS